jgi:hypothetical protein
VASCHERRWPEIWAILSLEKDVKVDRRFSEGRRIADMHLFVFEEVQFIVYAGDDEGTIGTDGVPGEIGIVAVEAEGVAHR